MSLPGKPWTSTDSRRAQRRTGWPDWLRPSGITFTLSMLSGVSYVGLYAFAVAFLARFGTTPEEVGLTQTALLVRAALFGSILTAAVFAVSLMAIAVVTICGKLFWWATKDEVALMRDGLNLARQGLHRVRRTSAGGQHPTRWRFGDSASVRHQTAVIAVTCGALVALAGMLLSPAVFGSPEANGVAGSLLLALILVLAFSFVARWRHAAAVAVTALLIIGLAVDWAGAAGSAAARDIAHDSREHAVVGAGSAAAEGALPGALGAAETHYSLQVAGLEVRIVCVYWATSAPPSVPQAVLYLGHANGVSLLSDGQQLFRVRDSQVKMIAAPLPGAPSITCPQPPP
ncbi:hypothetical protein [Geodermatophilus sp. DSM 45219]|uniref:hypothetical protein n=1 Tax=Geodermatophilus sp. DSM 45219 TaxID=1881103 RepID=UPI00088BAD35|nr:hypothetical protein [Geodermatophilus sp. DSM 45219]SDN38488.1 hypothetical protein SAMN05428965_0145 [Geodermatophilus sp. DSM 45219]